MTEGIIISIEKKFCTVLADKIKYLCKISKKLNNIVIGDYVYLSKVNNRVNISKIKERRTQFVRLDSDPSEKKRQIIAANFNYVFCVMSLNKNFNINRLKRMIILVKYSKAIPIILLTKADLVDSYEKYINEIKEEVGDFEIIVISVYNNFGINNLSKYLKSENIILLIGSSGVGKSSLINKLSNSNLLKIGGIRTKDDRGKHTTSSRKIVILENGCMIIDTPGIRTLGLIDMENAINEYYSDIISLSKKCKYTNCKHINEPGCMIIRSLQNGTLSKTRYNEFLNFLKESYRPFKLNNLHIKYNRSKEKRNIKKILDDY